MKWFLFIAVMSSAGGTSSQIVPVDTFEQCKMLVESYEKTEISWATRVRFRAHCFNPGLGKTWFYKDQG